MKLVLNIYDWGNAGEVSFSVIEGGVFAICLNFNGLFCPKPLLSKQWVEFHKVELKKMRNIRNC